MTTYLDRHSIRLRGYDYSNNGLYFITICVKDMQCELGTVVDGEVKLSDAGKIVHEEWLRTMELRGDTVEAHTFVVMPNHFHAIIGLKNPETLTVPEPKIQHFHDYSFKKTLGSIVRGFKASITSRLGYSVWQRNYYEHIIRNERSLLNIAEYIELNPVKWENDRFYK